MVLAVLSLGDLWAPLNALPLPLVSAERVSSRFLILPLLVLCLVAAWSTEDWIGQGRTLARKVAMAVLAVAIALSLLAHSRQWRIERLEGVLPPRTGRLEIAISPVPDPPSPLDGAYVATVRISGLVSAGALLTLGVWSLRSRLKRSSRSVSLVG